MIIHDLTKQQAEQLFQDKLHKDYLTAREEETGILSDNNTIRNCIGCFGCWVKTPGVCLLKDGYSNMGAMLGRCSQ